MKEKIKIARPTLNAIQIGANAAIAVGKANIAVHE
jgi:hypothetical protein